jgi:hypothetical protein
MKWFLDKENRYKLYLLYVLISSVAIVALLSIIIFRNYDITFFKNFEGLIITILTVLGVFIAFTAINIYSVFNVKVNDENYKLKMHREYCQQEMDKLNTMLEEQKAKDNRIMTEIRRSTLNSDIADIINKNISIVERTTTISRLTALIENKEREISGNNLIDKTIELQQELKRTKQMIKDRISPHNRELENEINQYFKSAFQKLKDKLN